MKASPGLVNGPDQDARLQEPILSIRELCKAFRTDESEFTVLQNIDFSVNAGELICILGRSGCGKTTLLNILAGFIPPCSGQVLLRGRPVSGPGPDRCVVFQQDALFPWLTVEENIAFGMHGPKQTITDEVRRFLDLVGLSFFRGYLPREISGGMKQRVALARVLIRKPSVLLMDEPFAALDAQTREEMQNLLLLLWHKLKHTILFVTHDVQEAVLIADRILVLDKDPGTIRKDIRIGLDRPRNGSADEYLRLCRDLLKQLRA